MKPPGDPAEYLPLTGAQKWLLNEMRRFKRRGWAAIDFLIKTKVPMDEKSMESAIRYLIYKYEILRVRIFDRDAQWVQEVYPPSEAHAFTAFDLCDETLSTRREKIKQVCIRERDWLLPERGNLLRIIFFKCSEREGRIWFCIHHVISDFVTVSILSREFMAIYNSIVQGNEPKWQASKDYRKWLYIVDGYCRDVLFPAELEYWLSLPWDTVTVLPSDYPDREPVVSACRTNVYEMDEEETSALLSRSGVEFENILIAGFFLAVTGQKKLEWLDINVMNSGRNILPPEYEFNMNKVLGYLAIVRTVLLKRPGYGDLSSDLQDVIAQIKRIPNGGVGFSLISHYIKNDQLRSSYLNLRRQPVLFNYLGRTDLYYENEQYEVAEEDTGQGLYGGEFPNPLLRCQVGIQRRRLFIKINYSEDYFTLGTIEGLLHAMIAILRETISTLFIEKVA
jgi:non-ribosomal peptide synthase protein (TIGR01720 family)